MDNASKALVMAGAILIAVMIISLGVLLFRKAADITEPVIDETRKTMITTYNNNWLNYEGDNKSASEVRAFIADINSHNNNSESVHNYGESAVTGGVVGDTQP